MKMPTQRQIIQVALPFALRKNPLARHLHRLANVVYDPMPNYDYRVFAGTADSLVAKIARLFYFFNNHLLLGEERLFEQQQQEEEEENDDPLACVRLVLDKVQPEASIVVDDDIIKYHVKPLFPLTTIDSVDVVEAPYIVFYRDAPLGTAINVDLFFTSGAGERYQLMAMLSAAKEEEGGGYVETVYVEEAWTRPLTKEMHTRGVLFFYFPLYMAAEEHFMTRTSGGDRLAIGLFFDRPCAKLRLYASFFDTIVVDESLEHTGLVAVSSDEKDAFVMEVMHMEKYARLM